MAEAELRAAKWHVQTLQAQHRVLLLEAALLYTQFLEIEMMETEQRIARAVRRRSPTVPLGAPTPTRTSRNYSGNA